MNTLEAFSLAPQSEVDLQSLLTVWESVPPYFERLRKASLECVETQQDGAAHRACVGLREKERAMDEAEWERWSEENVAQMSIDELQWYRDYAQTLAQTSTEPALISHHLQDVADLDRIILQRA